jgi:competence protein ComEC
VMPTQSMCYTGQQWVWDGVLFEVLYPNQGSYQAPDIKDNNRSCVIKVTSRYGSMLLTGDIEKAAEEALLETHLHSDNKQSKLKSDVMIAPHHGSKTSSSHALIHAVDAKNIIFTVGYLNRFKHPKPAIMHRYVANDSTLYRSDNDGAVLIDFTAQNPIQIKAWRSVRARYWHDKIL